VRGWLCRIATHAATDRLRRRKKGTVSIDIEDDERAAVQLASADVSADELVAQKGTRDFVVRAMAALSDEHRVVLLLKEVDGMTAQEIGEALGVPTGTVESRVHRARAMLGKHVARAAKREQRRWPW
jgi:RNA polymerase sigma-70 factor (ECF subfamily)